MSRAIKRAYRPVDAATAYRTGCSTAAGLTTDAAMAAVAEDYQL